MSTGLFVWRSKNMHLGNALHFIGITWFTYIFASIPRLTKWVQFPGCSLDLAI